MRKASSFIFAGICLVCAIVSTASKGFAVPFPFIENKGQWENAARFCTKLPQGELYLESNAWHFIFQHPDDIQNAFKHPRSFEKQLQSFTIRSHAVRIGLVNAATKSVTGINAAQTYFNFYIGNNPSLWKQQVHPFESVLYTEVYSNIDAKMYFNKEAQLKYDFWVNPNGDPTQIKLSYQGVSNIQIIKGKLRVQTSVNGWEEQEPYAYQIVNGQKIQIPCAFVLDGQTVSFALGTYQKNIPLVIDPVVVFSTYSGSSVDNFGHSATFDKAGHLYAAGIARNPTSFPNGTYPVTPGAFQQIWGGGVGSWPQTGFPCDMSISKYSSDGSILLFATYLGGNHNDYPTSLIADSSGNLFVLGTSLSTNFATTLNAYSKIKQDSFDIVISKLSPDGTQLLASTYLGGSGIDGVNIADTLRMNYADEFRGEIQLDPFGNVWIGSSTTSNNFPITPGALQATNGGKQDGVLCKLDANLSTLLASTYWGKQQHDAIYSIEPTNSGMYICGGTQSTNFAFGSPIQTSNFKGGISDAFIAFVNNTASAVNHFSYYGSAGYDQGFFVRTTPSGKPILLGQQFDSITPINASFYNAKGSVFISRFDYDLQTVEAATSIGNGNQRNALSPSAMVVDECGILYASIWGGQVNFQSRMASILANYASTTNNLPITSNALQNATDGSDFYIFAVNTHFDSLLYGSFLGELGDADHVDGGTSRFDSKGMIYQSVCASCNTGGAGSFPTTPNAYAPVNASPRCSNASTKIDVQVSNSVRARFTYAPQRLCLDSYLVVTFTNTSYNALQYRWRVNGLLKATSFQFTDTFFTAGTYTVSLTAIDSNRCVVVDSVSQTLVVSNLSVASFTSFRDTCSPNMLFTNTSSPAPFTWFFGNGDTSNSPFVQYQFPTDGTYQVLLVTNPKSNCADSATATVTYIADGHLAIARFSPNDTAGCEPVFFKYTYSGSNTSGLKWYINNTLIDTGKTIDSTFSKGRYTIELIVTDSNTCNKADTATLPLRIFPFAAADFTHTRDTCSFDVQLINQTLLLPGDTVNYRWDFGNGTFSDQRNPIAHYDTGGVYTVTLTANPGLPCAYQLSKPITIDTPDAALSAFFTLNPDTGCGPQLITLTNQSIQATSWYWFAGGILLDSNKTQLQLPYSTDTVVTFTLVAANPNSCKLFDTLSQTLRLFPETPSAFRWIRDTCSPNIQFVYTPTIPSLKPASLFWDFGDGNFSTDSAPVHQYTFNDTFTVTLVTNPGSPCADTSKQLVPFDISRHLLQPAFAFSQSGNCAPSIVVAQNQSTNGTRQEWYIQNTLVSVQNTYTDTFISPGNYILTLVVYDSLTCSKTDSLKQAFTVAVSGAGAFTLLRDSCALDIRLVNESQSFSSVPNAYLWNFGDGDTSTATNPTHTYQKSGVYTITLWVNKDSECADTVSQIVTIEGDTVQNIVVPNVFTPNNDGLNDCFMVTGLTTTCNLYQLEIYNRWGTKYFSTQNPTACWNGTNDKGIPASDGVYYYLLSIKRYGQPVQKWHGTITLIRD